MPGQTPNTSTPTVPTKITAPGFTVADGSANPDLIPDATAFRMVLGAFQPVAPVQSSNPDPQALAFAPTAHQAAKLKQLQLTAADTNVFLNAVSAWHGKIGLPAGSAALGKLDAAVGPVITQLQQQLTPAGWQAVYAYVRSKRGNMKILTGQPNAH
jgi:hypothetical protein